MAPRNPLAAAGLPSKWLESPSWVCPARKSIVFHQAVPAGRGAALRYRIWGFHSKALKKFHQSPWQLSVGCSGYMSLNPNREPPLVLTSLHHCLATRSFEGLLTLLLKIGGLLTSIVRVRCIDSNSSALSKEPLRLAALAADCRCRRRPANLRRIPGGRRPHQGPLCAAHQRPQGAYCSHYTQNPEPHYLHHCF